MNLVFFTYLGSWQTIPSGHAFMSVIFYGMITYFVGGWLIGFLILAFFILIFKKYFATIN